MVPYCLQKGSEIYYFCLNLVLFNIWLHCQWEGSTLPVSSTKLPSEHLHLVLLAFGFGELSESAPQAVFTQVCSSPNPRTPLLASSDRSPWIWTWADLRQSLPRTPPFSVGLNIEFWATCMIQNQNHSRIYSFLPWLKFILILLWNKSWICFNYF